VAALAFAAQGCRSAQDPWKEVKGGPTRVLVTVPALYSFVKSVGGSDAAVVGMLTTTGPHDYQPVHADHLLAYKADLFFSIGLELDEFVEKVVQASNNSKLELIQLGETALDKKLLLPSGGHESHEKEHGEEGEKGHHHHGEFDPHVWLGIPQAIAMVEHIRDTLQRTDPKNKDAYGRRAADYVEQLRKLHQDGLKMLQGKKNRKLVTMHESLGYLGKSFGLEIMDSIQPRPGIEADARKLAELVELCKKKDVRVIAVELQYSAGSAETLKAELKRRGLEVRLAVVDPMETARPAELTADYYVSKMRENLEHLAESFP
jgi:ABC-type Zn uptake system ZnuABC Zn-binding protein ZnuA